MPVGGSAFHPHATAIPATNDAAIVACQVYETCMPQVPPIFASSGPVDLSSIARVSSVRATAGCSPWPRVTIMIHFKTMVVVIVRYVSEDSQVRGRALYEVVANVA